MINICFLFYVCFLLKASYLIYSLFFYNCSSFCQPNFHFQRAWGRIEAPIPGPEQCELQSSGQRQAEHSILQWGTAEQARKGPAHLAYQSSTSGWGEVNSGAEVVHLLLKPSLSHAPSQLLPALPFQSLSGYLSISLQDIMQRWSGTSHECSRMCSDLPYTHCTRPTKWAPLLLHGMAISTVENLSYTEQW